MKPLLPFSSQSTTPSSSTSSTPYTSLNPSPASSKSFYPESPRQRPSFLPPLPPKKLWIPLILLGCASYAFVASYEALAPTTRILDDGIEDMSTERTILRQAWNGRAEYTEEEMKIRWEQATKPLPFETGTLERLENWENTLREVEAGEWVEKNLETCPDSRIRPNQNNQMLDKSHLVWASMSSRKILRMRREMADYIRGKIAEGALENYGSGKVSSFETINVVLSLRLLTFDCTLRVSFSQQETPIPSHECSLRSNFYTITFTLLSPPKSFLSPAKHLPRRSATN